MEGSESGWTCCLVIKRSFDLKKMHSLPVKSTVQTTSTQFEVSLDSDIIQPKNSFNSIFFASKFNHSSAI